MVKVHWLSGRHPGQVRPDFDMYQAREATWIAEKRWEF